MHCFDNTIGLHDRVASWPLGIFWDVLCDITFYLQLRARRFMECFRLKTSHALVGALYIIVISFLSPSIFM